MNLMLAADAAVQSLRPGSACGTSVPCGDQSPRFEGAFFQAARLGDVYLLGPFMLWFAWQAKETPDWARVVMGVSGLMTMGFNFRNYLLVEQAKATGTGCPALYRLT